MTVDGEDKKVRAEPQGPSRYRTEGANYSCGVTGIELRTERGAKTQQNKVECGMQGLSKMEHRSYVVRGTNRDIPHRIVEVGSA